ncbi:MAG: DsbA family oxidoreductase [Candidatus Melainabacteria bacterium]|nr:DsbA family oxidoreductase [Candidatus Melainabacteria bacterium]
MSEKRTASIQLDIYSDVICPWCYVGKARLDEALKTIGTSLNIKATWKPFELNPTMPSEGADRKEYMLKKFGTADISGMQTRLSTAGAENGVKFNFANIMRVPNTFNAHRLIWFAEKQGRQHELSEVLFRKYFFDGKDLGDIDNLISAAEEAGLNPASTQQFLNSTEGVEEVRKEEQEGREMGISAVPTFIVNGEIVASGAIPPSELVSLIEAAALASAK